MSKNINYLMQSGMLPEDLAVAVWETPMVQLGKEMGVSGRSIKKRCEKFGYRTPWRGYWRKVETGTLEPDIANEIAVLIAQLKANAKIAREQTEDSLQQLVAKIYVRMNQVEADEQQRAAEIMDNIFDHEFLS